MTRELVVPPTVLQGTHDALRRLGEGRREAVVLWAGAWPPRAVTRMVIPEQHQAFGRFSGTLSARGRLVLDLAAKSEALVAQVHTHPRRAFHSPLDDEEALPRRVGSFSLVIPEFAAAADLLTGAALYRLEQGGRWTEVALTSIRRSPP